MPQVTTKEILNIKENLICSQAYISISRRNNCYKEFSLLDIKIKDSPFVNQDFQDPLLKLIIESIIRNLNLLEISTDQNLIEKLNDYFKNNELSGIFGDLQSILRHNSISISNLNIFIMAQTPRFKQPDCDYKILIKDKLKEILGNQINQISVHAGTGEKIGKVGNKEAIDFHVLVNLVKEEELNKKIIGYGFDRHQLVDQSSKYYEGGKKNFLGTCEFDLFKNNTLQIKAHSDGDLILHSICNAILAALGESDIGDFFPDTDPRYKNKESLFFVKAALEKASEKNLQLKEMVINLFVSEDIAKEIDKEKILKSISDKLELSSNSFMEFNVITEPWFSNQDGCIAKSEGIEAQVFLLLESNEFSPINLKNQI